MKCYCGEIAIRTALWDDGDVSHLCIDCEPEDSSVLVVQFGVVVIIEELDF